MQSHVALLGPGWAEARDDEGNRRLDSQDDWVRLEIARALNRGITVISVRINGADLPKKSSLPEDIRGLLDHQATVVTNTGFRNEMAGLFATSVKSQSQKNRQEGCG